MNSKKLNSSVVPATGSGGGLIYNVTIKVQEPIKEEWLNWLKTEHIPDVIETGCFTQATILHLLEADESEGPTYAIQYIAESKAQYNRYMEIFAPTMRQRSLDKWGDKFIAFRTLLQVVN